MCFRSSSDKCLNCCRLNALKLMRLHAWRPQTWVMRVLAVSEHSRYDHTGGTFVSRLRVHLTKFISSSVSACRFVTRRSRVPVIWRADFTPAPFIAPSCHSNCIKPLKTLLLLNDSDCLHCKMKSNNGRRRTDAQTVYHTDVVLR